jgi:hypothetical protein
MKKALSLLLAGAMLTTAGVAEARQRSPEQQLSRITAGRTAGEPANCIFLREINSTEIIRNTAIVYRMNNGTIYVNHPDSGANFLDRDDILVTDTHSPQLCNVDIVRLLDSGSRMTTGSVGLGKFVPYPRVRRSASN